MTNYQINDKDKKGVSDGNTIDLFQKDLGLNIDIENMEEKFLTKRLKINLKRVRKGPKHLWHCIACDRTFEMPLYSHRECPFCKSDLIVIVDISEL